MKAILTTYKGHSSKSGARIVAQDSDGNKVVYNPLDTKDEPYLHHDQAFADAARMLCKKMNWRGRLVHGGLGAGKQVFVWLGDKEWVI